MEWNKSEWLHKRKNTALVFTAWVNYERLLSKNVEVGNMEAAEPRLVVIYEAASATADISSPAETLIFMLSLRADFFSH